MSLRLDNIATNTMVTEKMPISSGVSNLAKTMVEAMVMINPEYRSRNDMAIDFRVVIVLILCAVIFY
jgi:hypothetical protein